MNQNCNQDSKPYLLVALVCAGSAERECQLPFGAEWEERDEQVLRRENSAVDHPPVRALGGGDPLEVGDDWGGVAEWELAILADVRVQAADVHQSSLLSRLCLPVQSEGFGSSSHEAIADLNTIW